MGDLAKQFCMLRTGGKKKSDRLRRKGGEVYEGIPKGKGVSSAKRWHNVKRGFRKKEKDASCLLRRNFDGVVERIIREGAFFAYKEDPWQSEHAVFSWRFGGGAY